MKQQKLRDLPIDSATFDDGFNRDLMNEGAPETWYLDCATGEVLVVYDNDRDAWYEWGVSCEDNKRTRTLAESNPTRFLELRRGNYGGAVERGDLSEADYLEYMAEVDHLLVTRGLRAIWT